MKKKIDKTIILKDSDLSKAGVSIIEANQTQQAVVLQFSNNDNLSKYSLAVCAVSPLLNSPEKIINTLITFHPIEVAENQKVYVIFNSEKTENFIDDDGNAMVYIKTDKRFDLKNDEALALLENSDGEKLKIIDWSNAIIDEPVPIEQIEKLKDDFAKKKSDIDLRFYKKKKPEPESGVEPGSTIFDKDFFWLIFFISLLSVFSIISTFSFKDTLFSSLLKILSIILLNFVSGFTLFKWYLASFKNSIKYSFLLWISAFLLIFSGFLVGIYTVLIQSVILYCIILILSFKIKKNKPKV